MSETFDGLHLGLGNLARLSDARSRCISPENPTGEPGGGARASGSDNPWARDLGPGWKCRPYVRIASGNELDLADIAGPGVIQSIWMGGYVGRDFVLRVYYDGQVHPSIEAPVSDFFALPWVDASMTDTAEPLVTVNSLPVSVCPNKGLNCFWPMPFRGRCRVTMQNLNPREERWLFYSIHYALTDVPEDCAYFHAQFRRVNPLGYKQPYVILDSVEGRGHYVGTSMGWGVNNNGWWGEGEVKFYIDDDAEHPTICGTGLEDYVGGAFNWEVAGRYQTYSHPYHGMHWLIQPDGVYRSQHRHALYRWHVMDPVRFRQRLRVTVQALGWRGFGEERRYHPGQHDICSVAYWYQSLPSQAFPPLPDRDALEIV